MKYRFIDLFAGAGGLSEGFIRAGYEPIAHIEMDHYACDSLKTRAAFHYLKENGKLEIYEEYLKNKKEKTDGSWLWNKVPKSVIDSVIQEAIGKETLPSLFERVDKLCNGTPVDMIIVIQLTHQSNKIPKWLSTFSSKNSQNIFKYKHFGLIALKERYIEFI